MIYLNILSIKYQYIYIDEILYNIQNKYIYIYSFAYVAYYIYSFAYIA